MTNYLKYLVAIVIFLFSVNAFAAGSSTVISDDTIYKNSETGSSIREIIVSFTSDDTDGSIPDITINKNTAGVVHGGLEGWHLWVVFIDCNHAGTEPTEDSDIVINMNGVDILDGNGADIVDNTAERSVYPSVDSGGFIPIPITGDIIAAITQAVTAENSATGTIYLIFK